MSKYGYDFNQIKLSKQRSSWNITKSHKTSLPFGKLVPLGAPVDVLPGDTFKLDIGAIIRMLTPKAPLMDGISGDVYAYFTPYRILYDRTKQFFGENETQAWTLNLSHNLPHITFSLARSNYVSSSNGYAPAPGQYFIKAGNLLDHFELPFLYLSSAQYDSIPKAPAIGTSLLSIQAMPFRNYQMIWNFDFRNPSVVDPMLSFNYDHSDVTLSSILAVSNSSFDLKPVMRYRDLFSSGLKAPQRGPSVSVPLGTVAPIIANGAIKFRGENDQVANYLQAGTASNATSPVNIVNPGQGVAPDGNLVYASGLNADLTNATAATVNLLRTSIATQHLYELMTSVFRYHEYTDVFFGVRASNVALDNPQQLGGLHFDINVSQVLSTAEGTNSSVGDTGAFSATNIKGHIFTNSFQEHGIIQLFVVLRKEHTYIQGLDKYWRKRDFFDLFQPPLEGIGNVDIKNSEIWCGFDSNGGFDDGAFAYTEPYYEYRWALSKACGLMNPLHPNSLSFYSLTDVLSSKPYLNETFVSEDPNGLDNALVASASVTDQFFADFYFKYTTSRCMKLRSIPGLNRI